MKHVMLFENFLGNDLKTIASEIRKKLEVDADWENNRACFNGQCAIVSDIVTDEFKEKGFKAETVWGHYQTKTGWVFHMFTLVDDSMIVDLTADQFHPGEEEKYKVVVTGSDNPVYKLK